jgi:hypothetical protein
MVFDIFVSYIEITGRDFAAEVKQVCPNRNYQAFVSHIDRRTIKGKFEVFIDNIIFNSKIFILILTQDIEESVQVRRELEKYSEYTRQGRNIKLLILYHRNYLKNRNPFDDSIPIKLQEEEQIDFTNGSELCRELLKYFDTEKTTIDTAYDGSVDLATTSYNYYLFHKNTNFRKGSKLCWLTGSISFDDIHDNLTAERNIIREILNALEFGKNFLIEGPI